MSRFRSAPAAHSTMDMDMSALDITDTNINAFSNNNNSNHNKNQQAGWDDDPLDISFFSGDELRRDANSHRQLPNNHKTAAHNINNDILSPQIPRAEVNKYFSDFTQDFTTGNDKSRAMPLYDHSIEIGRGKTRNLSAHFGRRSSSASSNDENRNGKETNTKRNDNNVNDKGGGEHYKRTPFKEQQQSESSEIVIPEKYRQGDTYTASHKNQQQQQQQQQRSSDGPKSSYANKFDYSMPDITGLSSIFTSDDHTNLPGYKNSRNSHKKIVSVPVDYDDQAIMSAMQSFSKKIKELTAEKEKLTGRVQELEKQAKQSQQKFDEQSNELEDAERRARKYKTMAAAMRDKIMNEGAGDDYWKTQYEQLKVKAQQVLKERNDDALGIHKNRDYKIDELEMKETLGPQNKAGHGQAQAQTQSQQKSQSSSPTEPQSQPQPPSQQPQSSVPSEAPQQQSALQSELQQIKDLLLQLLESRNTDSEPSFFPEAESTQFEETGDDAEDGTDYEVGSSIIEQLQEVVQRLKEQKPSSKQKQQQASQRKHPRFDIPPAQRTSTEPLPQTAQSTGTTQSSRSSVPRLVDRVYSAMPQYCEACSSSGSNGWATACTHKTRPVTFSEPPPPPSSSSQYARPARYPSQSEAPWLSLDEDAQEEANETPRPAMNAEENIKLILDGMGQEFSELKSRYQDMTQSYTGHNPSMHRRERQQAAESLKALMNNMEVKADQIYALYDVMAEANIHVEDPEWIKQMKNDQQKRQARGEWIQPPN